MKNAILLAMMIVFIGCKKEKSDTEEGAIRDKLQGKWQVIREVDQIWEPINTLTYSENNPVGPGDSIVFKSNTILGYWDNQLGAQVEEVDYTILDSMIVIDEEFWMIKKLTEHELVLQNEDIDQANNRKDVLITYLER